MNRLSAILVVAVLVALGAAAFYRVAAPEASSPAIVAADELKPTGVTEPEVIDQQGYRDVLAKLRGRPLMVNFWATWCEPCRDEYPMVNELAREYHARGLVVIAVSLDEETELEQLRKFLETNKPVFANYRKRPGRDEEFINAVTQRWSGAIPATFFYDGDGKLVTQLVGEFKRPAFEAALRKILR
jgi:thiol-disulfide isomerase/thioredoxin